jgi:hypothetical protein
MVVEFSTFKYYKKDHIEDSSAWLIQWRKKKKLSDEKFCAL